MKTAHFLLTAGIALAMAFIFSCSSDGDGCSGNDCFLEESFSSVEKEGDIPIRKDIETCEGFADGTKRMHYGKEKAQFCDERDGAKYAYVTIGEQTWMAENLRYAAEGSACYGENGAVYTAMSLVDSAEIKANCAKYRLYNWETALEVCPKGWHLPSRAEWEALKTSIDTTTRLCVGEYYHRECITLPIHEEWDSPEFLILGNKAGQHLKAQEGWMSCGPSGTTYYSCDDTYGFTALAIGGKNASWWSNEGRQNYRYDSETGAYTYAYAVTIQHDKELLRFGGFGLVSSTQSVRCVKD